MDHESKQVPRIERVTLEDLEVPVPPLDGTVVVFQRHGHDNRDPENHTVPLGALFPESVEKIRRHDLKCFREMFERMTVEERSEVDILFVSSDTSLRLADERILSDRKRAVDTGIIAMRAMKAAMEEYGVSSSQVMNRDEQPIELKSGIIKDTNIFDHSRDFVNFLVAKYGDGQPFWAAYEGDYEQETRLAMGAEGPLDIAERLRLYLVKLDHSIASYHRKHPGRRVLVWANTHYDTISAFVKRYAANMHHGEYVKVDNGGGIAIEIDADRNVSVSLNGHAYLLDLSAS